MLGARLGVYNLCMSLEPRPLAEGFLLAGRFEVETVLGRGGFGIVYRAQDLQRNDTVVVKELAPSGVRRNGDGVVELDMASSPRLRQQFLDEARTMARLNLQGVLPMRTSFTENGTAYYVTDYLPNAVPLERLLKSEGRMDMAGALDILYQLMETLEQVHQRGILHRDIKPSNILVTPGGEATLIDFGAAREWHADASVTHTVLFTPAYAPLEQMAERARRGPATDIYSLCATAYEMLTGHKPTPATDRASGVGLIPIATLRPDVESTVADALEAGMALKLTDRPQNIAALRTLLNNEPEEEPHGSSLLEMDAKMVRLQRFSFERRQCPACKELLEEPRPLRKGICPVCHEGTIKKREIHPGLCPVCRVQPMKEIRNLDPMHTCPRCKTGWLTIKKKGLLSKEIIADCPDCEAHFEGNSQQANGRTWVDWLEESERSESVRYCDGCGAQMDREADGRYALVVSERALKHTRLYLEERDCVAVGLEPGSGNAECMLCGADFYLYGDNVTLLSSKDDPFGFAKDHLGRLLTLEDNRWMGVGKQSPHPGLICHHCHTELDRDGEYLRVVRTRNRALARHLDQPIKLADLHRLAEGLPTISEEADFGRQLLEEVSHAYEKGDLGFDDGNTILWRGPASRTDSDGNGNLSITREEVQFGGVFRKWKIPFDAILEASSDGSTVWLRVSGEAEPVGFAVSPIALTSHLQSGRYTVELGPNELAARITSELRPRC